MAGAMGQRCVPGRALALYIAAANPHRLGHAFSA